MDKNSGVTLLVARLGVGAIFGRPHPDIPDFNQIPALRGQPYVSPDFGRSWTRMADTVEVAENPLTGSALSLLGAATHYEPGIQAYYNLWVKPDPTSTDTTAFAGVRYCAGDRWVCSN